MLLSLTIIMSFLLHLTYSFLCSKKKKSKLSLTLLSFSSLGGFLTVCCWFLWGSPHYMLSYGWLSNSLCPFSFSFTLDPPFILFLFVALFVTWSIIDFTHYYMATDPNMTSFINTLVLFLFFMLLLVASNNLFTLFVGWEGVGILSFMLISWWFTRTDANSAALQAIMYNRLGDGGMILFMALSIMFLKTWDLKTIMYLSPTHLFPWAWLGMMLAAAGKSAQFVLHPWLPAAMEGPTPVSALLHSSTMVVAGVFLLYRCSPMLKKTPLSLLMVGSLGALTSLFAASVAILQYDLKKVIAYSTTSQLGLMVVAMGLNIPLLALFHICTHAFFKALLFLCSGSIIHNLKNEQDLRKMGKIFNTAPLTLKCMIMGSIALCGAPFLAGYYSKDLMLEASQNSTMNFTMIILALIATLFTALYSLRVIFFLTNNFNLAPLNPSTEEYPHLMAPLIRLAVGALMSGWGMAHLIFTHPPMMIAWSKKMIPMLLMGAALMIVFKPPIKLPTTTLKKIAPFLYLVWYYSMMHHCIFTLGAHKKSMTGVLRTLDWGWTSTLGPNGMATAISPFVSDPLQQSQTGVITNYLKFSMLLALLVFLSISFKS